MELLLSSLFVGIIWIRGKQSDPECDSFVRPVTPLAGVARYIFGAAVFTVKHTFCPHLFDSFSSTKTGLLNGPAMINTSHNNYGSVRSEIYQFTPYI